MIESFFFVIFVLIVFVLAIMYKKILYIDEHVHAIENELNTFNDNFKAIQNIENQSDFKLGTGHIY
jgi:hypothetical protein